MKKYNKIWVKIKGVILPYGENQWRTNRKWIIIAGCFIFGGMVCIWLLPSGQVSKPSDLSAEQLYEKGKREYLKDNYSEAVDYYRSAAEKGLPDAMNAVAWCYLKGNGVQVDKSKAYQWYTSAAEKGHRRAMYNLGKCYHEGWGVDKDTYLAYKWYKKGAEKGDAEAQNALAWCYWKGTGTKQDIIQSVVWYGKAAQQWHPRAMYNLACLWEELKAKLENDLKSQGIWVWLKVKMGMCNDEEINKTINTLYYQSALLGDELAKNKVNQIVIKPSDCIPVAILIVRLGAAAAGCGF